MFLAKQPVTRLLMIEFSQWQFNPENGLLVSDIEQHKLPPRLVKLLLILTQYAPRLVEKQTLISEIWQDKIVNEDALARLIAELRKLLGDNSSSPVFIETVPRRGYRFIPEVNDGQQITEHRGEDVRRTGSAFRWVILALLLLFVWLVAGYLFFPEQSLQTTAHQWQSAINNAKRLSADAKMEFQPEISPDGQLIAYGIRENEDMVVNIVDSSGNQLYQIAEPGGWIFSPAWSPDSKKLAVALVDLSKCTIFVVNLPSLTRQRIGSCGVPNQSGLLDWSPDGRKIAFVNKATLDRNKATLDSSQHQISVYHIESGDITVITEPPTGAIFDSRPRFSRDGESLFFLRGSRSARDIYRTELSDSGHVTRLTESKNFKLGFTLSDTGDEIVFDSNSNGDRNLWLLSLADLSIQNLGARDGQSPSLSNDGLLLYQEVRYQANLWYFDLLSKQSKLIVDSPKYDNFPVISPDSEQVAYVSNRFGRAEVWLYDRKTEQDVRLFSLDDADLLEPEWSVDGARLLMSSRGDEGYSCFEMTLESREVRQIKVEGMELYNCRYRQNNRIVAIDKTENAGSNLVEITPERVTRIATGGVSKALPLSNGDIVLSWVAKPGLYLLESGSGSIRPILPEFPNQQIGRWTVSGDLLYFLNPQKNDEVLALDVLSNEQSVVLTGLNVGVGDSIAISPDSDFAVISQKGSSQSNLFVTAKVR